MGQQVTLTISAEDTASGVIAKVAEGLDKLGKQSETLKPKLKPPPEAASGWSQFFAGLETVSMGVQRLLTPMNLLTGAVGVGLVAAMRSAISSASEMAIEISRMQAVTGATVEEITSLQSAVDAMGGSAGALQRALFLMSFQIESGGAGLKRMGISVVDANDNMKDELPILKEVADHLARMTSSTRAATEAKQALGRGVGAVGDLLPLLLKGSAGIDQLGESGRKFGQEFGQRGVEDMRRFRGAVNEVHDAEERLKITIVHDMVPALELMNHWITSTLEAMRSIDPGTRRLIEGLILTTSAVLALAAGWKMLVGAWAFVANVGIIAWLVRIGVAALALVTPVGAVATAITALVLTFATMLTFDIGGIRSKWGEIFDYIGGKTQWIIDKFEFLHQTWEKVKGLVGLGSTPGVVPPEFPPRMVREAEPEQKSLSESILRDRLAFQGKLIQSAIELATATQTSEAAQVFAIKKTLEQRIAELDFQDRVAKDSESKAQTAVLRIKAEEVASAKITQIYAQERLKLLGIQNQTADQQLEIEKSTADAILAGRVDTIEQSKILLKNQLDDFKLSQEDFLRTTILFNKEELAHKETGIQLEMTLAKTMLERRKNLIIEEMKANIKTKSVGNAEILLQETTTNKQLIDLDGKLAGVRRDNTNATVALERQTSLDIIALIRERLAAGADLSEKWNQFAVSQAQFTKSQALQSLEEEKKVLQNRFQTYTISQAELTNALIAIAERELSVKTQLVEDERKAIISSAQNRLEMLQEMASVGPVDAKKQAAEELSIRTDLFIKLQGLNNEALADFAEYTAKKTELRREEARVAGVLYANEAGAIEEQRRKRDQSIQNISVVLEEQARLAGDLDEAFVVGFAHAASSADDASKAMAKSGADAFSSLKSSLSDYLFAVITGAGKISDIFINLGKRILRSMTDAFAEILAKQIAMAAGFSLTGFLGIAGTAAAGFEGAPNETAKAITSLGTAATGSADALSGMTGVLGLVMRVLMMFGNGLMGILSFFGQIIQGIASGGGIVNTLTSAFSSLVTAGSSLMSVFSGLSSIGSTVWNAFQGMGGLADIFQSVFNALGLTSGGFGSGVVVAGGKAGVTGAAGQYATFLQEWIPVAGALYALATTIQAFFKGDLERAIGGTVGGIIGGAIGSIWGPAGTFIGFTIGNFIGSFIGGFFSKTPKATLSASIAPFDRNAIGSTIINGPGPNGHVPGQFPGLGWATQVGAGVVDVGGNVLTSKKEDALQLMLAAALNTLLQKVVTVTVAMLKVLPPTISAQLDAALTAIETNGLTIADWSHKGKKAGKRLQQHVEHFMDDALQAMTEGLGFGNVDLKALGGGDVAKGFESMTMALSALSAIVKEAGPAIDLSGVSLAQFTRGAIDLFKGFAKDGETFTDTIKRVTQTFGEIISLKDQIHTSLATISGDLTEVVEIIKTRMAAAENSLVATVDALTIAIESGAKPEEVLAAAQAATKAITDTLKMEVEAVTMLHDAVLKLNASITGGVDLIVSLTQKIDALRGTLASALFIQAGIDGIVYLFNSITDVTARIALFAAGLVLLSESVGGILGNIPLVVAGFNEIMAGIQQMTNPADAVAALRSLAGAIETGLQTGIAAINRQTQERITALNAEKVAIQEHYTKEIGAIKATQTAAMDLKAKLDNLTSAIKLATTFTSELNTVIAKLSGTYSALTDFSQLLTAFPEKIAAIRAIASPQDAITALQALAQEVQQALAAAIQDVQAHFTALREEAQKAAQVRIDTLTAEKTAAQAAFQVRKDALNKELDLARQWGTLLSGVKQLQTEITTLLVPLHPQTSLNDVQAQFRVAFAEFQAGPTPELGANVQDLAKQLLALAKQTPGFDLPSMNFQNLVQEIQAALTAVASIAGAKPTEAQVQEKIAALNQEEVDTLKVIDDKIAKINTDLQAKLTDLSKQEQSVIKALQNQAVVVLRGIRDELAIRLADLLRQQSAASAALLAILGDKTYEQFIADTNAQIKTLEEQQVAALKEIDKKIEQATLEGQEQIKKLQELAALGLEAIRAQLIIEVTALAAQQAQEAAALKAILGDKTYEQFIADKQRETALLLRDINATLEDYLGRILLGLFPGAQTPTPAQLQEASSGFSTLAQFAQSAGYGTLAGSLGNASQSVAAGNVPATITALNAASQAASIIPFFQSGQGVEFLSQFNHLINLTQQGQFISAIRILTDLLHALQSAGSYAEGSEYIPRTGLATLHRGERVLTAEENRIFSNLSSLQNRGGNTNISLRVDVTTSGEVDPKRLADQLEGELVERLRVGRLNAAIKEIRR